MLKYFINRKNRSRKELKKIKNKDIKKLELYIFYFEDEINDLYFTYIYSPKIVCSIDFVEAKYAIKFLNLIIKI